MVSNDADLLYMWDHIKAVKGVYHLYVEESSGPTPLIDTTTNEYPTTPTKKVVDYVNDPRKSYRPNNQSSRSQVTLDKSPKYRVIETMRVRRSPRLAGKSKSRFVSSELVILSDDEDVVLKEKVRVPVVDKGKKIVVKGDEQVNGGENAVVPLFSQLTSNINNLDPNDDWVIKNLIETICE